MIKSLPYFYMWKHNLTYGNETRTAQNISASINNFLTMAEAYLELAPPSQHGDPHYD